MDADERRCENQVQTSAFIGVHRRLFLFLDFLATLQSSQSNPFAIASILLLGFPWPELIETSILVGSIVRPRGIG